MKIKVSCGPQAIIQCWAIIGPPWKRYYMAFRWRAGDGPLLVILRTSLRSQKKAKLSGSAHVC